MTTNPKKTRAIANPTKSFFVNMITRDITLEDSIMDLIDNSIDGAWRNFGNAPIGLDQDVDLSKFKISITISPDLFSISDNCGGMTLDDAANHAFSFGRTTLQTYDAYSIGVYGIGMKRAAFKLGTDIHIASTYKDADGTRQSFAVPIIVKEWLNDNVPPWDFDIVEHEDLKCSGVHVVIRQLTPAAQNSFANPAFLQNLRRTIARDYSLHLGRHLTIDVNDDPIHGMQLKLRKSDEYVPMRLEYQDPQDSSVTVEIIGGMGAAPPEDIHPDETDNGDKRFGWYVACNGRIVLAADKTSVSGWGTPDWPQWHRQYSGFLGIVLFSAEDTMALPLTTTKRSVDVSSGVFLRARRHMRDVSKKWIAYTNARKQGLDEAKAKELKATAVWIRELSAQKTVTLPSIAPRPVETVANVNYAVSRRRMRKLAKEFGSANMPYREVGIRSFDYAYDDLAGDE